MEVSLWQGFKQQESLCATEERKVVYDLCAVAQSLKDFLHLWAWFAAGTWGLKSGQSRGTCVPQTAEDDSGSECTDGVGGGWEHLSLPFGEGTQCVEAVLEAWWPKKTGNTRFRDGGDIFIRSTRIVEKSRGNSACWPSNGCSLRLQSLPHCNSRDTLTRWAGFLKPLDAGPARLPSLTHRAPVLLLNLRQHVNLAWWEILLQALCFLDPGLWHTDGLIVGA